MNLLAIIIVFLAIAAAGGIIYAAWELSSDKPRRERPPKVTGSSDGPRDQGVDGG